MSFLCQKNSYLKTIESKIISCISSKKFKDCYDVIFEQSLVFPEGGGQPSDHATITQEGKEVAKVINAYREGPHAISVTDNAIPENSSVTVNLDFQRRFDHMQQHTGQHLISAFLEKSPYNWPTTSWWLGSNTCNVELDTKIISQAQIIEIETKLNEILRSNKSDIKIHYTDKAGADELGASTRGLPNDHVGELRVVELPGIDMNLCCGTHLNNLQELQVIKLLGTEKGKKGKTLLNFICGNRVFSWMNFALQHQAQLSSILKGGPITHVDKTNIIMKNMKTAERGLRTCLRDLAVIEAEKLKNDECIDLHRKDGSFEYINIISQGLNSTSSAILTVGDEKAKPANLQFIIQSSKLESLEIQTKILSLLDGKGSCKNNRLQGKCTSLKNRKSILQILMS